MDIKLTDQEANNRLSKDAVVANCDDHLVFDLGTKGFVEKGYDYLYEIAERLDMGPNFLMEEVDTREEALGKINDTGRECKARHFGIMSKKNSNLLIIPVPNFTGLDAFPHLGFAYTVYRSGGEDETADLLKTILKQMEAKPTLSQ